MNRPHDDSFAGLLVIGDPHLEGRQPDFRKDDFPEVVLNKLQWCLNYAKTNSLLPTFLGDMFQNPRDNPTWMLSRLIEMMRDSCSIGIYGNHDCAEPTLNENDSLTILVKSGCLRLVDYQNPWRGEMNGRAVCVGGSSYRQPIPDSVEIQRPATQSLFESKPLTIWLTHHDIEIPGYEGGHLKPTELKNIDLLINGHVHKRLESVQSGNTLWMTPGNITRRNRSDRNRAHIPCVLEIAVTHNDYTVADIEVPHQTFDDVFFESQRDEDADSQLTTSGFVAGLKELVSRKTQSGAGLHQFLNENLVQFDTPVANEIRELAKEITKTELTSDAQ